MKRKLLLIIYCIILYIATSCQNPVIDEIPETVEIPETIIETPVIIEEEIKEVELKPIEVFEKYAVSDKKVFGLEGNSLTAIVLKDSEDNIVLFNDFFIAQGHYKEQAQCI